MSINIVNTVLPGKKERFHNETEMSGIAVDDLAAFGLVKARPDDTLKQYTKRNGVTITQGTNYENLVFNAEGTIFAAIGRAGSLRVFTKSDGKITYLPASRFSNLNQPRSCWIHACLIIKNHLYISFFEDMMSYQKEIRVYEIDIEADQVTYKGVIDNVSTGGPVYMELHPSGKYVVSFFDLVGQIGYDIAVFTVDDTGFMTLANTNRTASAALGTGSKITFTDDGNYLFITTGHSLSSWEFDEENLTIKLCQYTVAASSSNYIGKTNFSKDRTFLAFNYGVYDFGIAKPADAGEKFEILEFENKPVFTSHIRYAIFDPFDNTVIHLINNRVCKTYRILEENRFEPVEHHQLNNFVCDNLNFSPTKEYVVASNSYSTSYGEIYDISPAYAVSDASNEIAQSDCFVGYVRQKYETGDGVTFRKFLDISAPVPEKMAFSDWEYHWEDEIFTPESPSAIPYYGVLRSSINVANPYTAEVTVTCAANSTPTLYGCCIADGSKTYNGPTATITIPAGGAKTVVFTHLVLDTETDALEYAIAFSDIKSRPLHRVEKTLDPFPNLSFHNVQTGWQSEHEIALASLSISNEKETPVEILVHTATGSGLAYKDIQIDNATAVGNPASILIQAHSASSLTVRAAASEFQESSTIGLNFTWHDGAHSETFSIAAPPVPVETWNAQQTLTAVKEGGTDTVYYEHTPESADVTVSVLGDMGSSSPVTVTSQTNNGKSPGQMVIKFNNGYAIPGQTNHYSVDIQFDDGVSAKKSTLNYQVTT